MQPNIYGKVENSKLYIALSTYEAAYMARAAATQEAKFLIQLFTDMHGCSVKSVSLYVDNQGAIALARNPVHQKSKHIDIRYHFVRLEVQRGYAQLQYIHQSVMKQMCLPNL